jgi:hypothetical protein
LLALEAEATLLNVVVGLRMYVFISCIQSDTERCRRSTHHDI